MTKSIDPENASPEETAAEFLKRRAGSAKPEDMLPFLDNAGNEPPTTGDEAA